MSDSLPEDAWVSSFLPSPPRPLLNSLQKRLAASTSHVTALADLYKQRAAIEQQYADALAKLARTAENGGLIPKNGTEWERGGGEGKIWENVVSDLAETSTSHSTLAAMLRTDFEQPIRELPSKIIAWRRIGEQDSSLDKTLKDYEKTAGKLEKAKKGKADQYQSELNQLTQSISSLCPMVYTTYQRLDEQRLKSLKEIVVRWRTIQGDMAVREGERAERAVGNMLGWEPADEVLAVGTRLGGSAGSGGRGGSVAPSIASMPSMDRRVSAASDFSPRPSVRQNGSSSNVSSPAPPSSFGGGLKSMLGRSKTLARNRSSSNAASTRTGRDDPVESISEDRTEPQPERTERAVDQDGFSVPPPDRHRSLWEEPDEEIPMPKSAPIVPSKSDSLAPPIEPAPATPNSAPFAQTFESSPTGSQEALSKPKLNLAINTAPIEESEEERQAALQKMQQTLQLPPSQPSRRNTTRGRRDVRNTMFGMPGAVHTEEPDIMSTPNGTRSNNPFESPALAAPTLPVASGPGLRANITEAINVIMRAGEIKRLQITGEIHMGVQAAHGPIHIRLDAFERLEKIAPNPQYLSQVPDTPGEYILNSEHLSSATAGPKGTLLFKYQVHVSADDQKSVLPLFLEPAFQIKDGETRMILNHRTASAHTLSSLSLVAMFEPGPNVPDVKTKPSGGVWSNSTRRMTWNVGTLQQGDGKIIAKFTNELPGALTPIGVQASWAVEGQLASGIGIQVVDGRLEEVTKGLVTGKYLAEAVIT